MLCPDCGKEMSGYHQKEYDRSAQQWCDIWLCRSENKWWERQYGNWKRRFDLEGAEEPGACQTQTRCPKCKEEGGITLSAVYESVVFVSCSKCGYSTPIDMATIEGIDIADYYFEFSRFNPYGPCPDVACAPYKAYDREKLHSLCSEYWHCPIMKYVEALCEVELLQELVEKAKPKVKSWLGKMEEHTKGWLSKTFGTRLNNKCVAAYKWKIFRTILREKNEFS